jgi:hypothetical protein
MDSYVEAIRQLRGQALGAVPNKKPKTVLVQGAGGMLAAGAVTILANSH